MQPLALSHQQLCVNGLLGQRVSKGKLVCPFFTYQLSCHDLFEEDKQLSFITVHDLLQQGDVEAPTGNSSKG